MRDRIVITIEPPLPDERLDIADAFQEVIDLLKLVELSAGEDAEFDWKLEKASTNSPFTVVALAGRPVSPASGETLAVAQRRVERGLRQLAVGKVPTWMRQRQRIAARRLAKRLHSGIGRVALRPLEGAKQVFKFNSADAQKVLATLNKVDGVEELHVPKHRAYGEIEGTLMSAGTHHGKPVVFIQTSGYEVVKCAFTDAKLRELGDGATIREIWEHKRVRVVGTLHFLEGGILDRVAVDDMQLFPSSGFTLEQILDAEFTSGMEPPEYLDKLHQGGFH